MEFADRLADAFADVNTYFEEGHRCRYDSQYLMQAPLGPKEKNRKVNHCVGCRYKGRKSDPYCQQMMRVWNILKQEDAELFSCNCPEHCSIDI